MVYFLSNNKKTVECGGNDFLGIGKKVACAIIVWFDSLAMVICENINISFTNPVVPKVCSADLYLVVC
jgi:hypothetical protein